MIPLTGVCKISTSLFTGGGYIHTILESTSRANTLFFTEKAVEGRYILVIYALDVWVKRWTFMIHEKYDLTAKFKWQTSMDGETWMDIGDAIITTRSDLKAISMNKAMWIIDNPAAEGSKRKYWRLLGLNGSMTSHPWVNIMLMDVV